MAETCVRVCLGAFKSSVVWYFGMFRYSYHNQLLRRKRERSAITLRTCARRPEWQKARADPMHRRTRKLAEKDKLFPAGESRAGGNGRNFSNPFFNSTPAKSLINNTTSHFTFRLLLQLEGREHSRRWGKCVPCPLYPV